ncbi:CBS domain-containing protein [Thalassobacillus hwangdonensis]|uniref:CBS domain-containing protein n=1 Tax=Thalassobacillus hwangdonensis TaxID=546108 RepID=A0ABW3L241_9BACI
MDREGLTERFEIAFNQVHQSLKQLNEFPKNDNFAELLNRSKQKHSIIRFHFDTLKQYAKLRNAIVHERVRDDYFIATPHEEVVETLEEISHTLEQPPLALTLASEPVIYYRKDSLVSHVLEGFSRYQVAQFPIYDTGHTYCGLLTSEGVVRWLHEKGEVGEGVLAEDILEHEREHSIHFLREDSSLFELEEAFEVSFEEGRKLKAVMITEDGERDRKPLGIVTAWDIFGKMNRYPDGQG